VKHDSFNLNKLFFVTLNRSKGSLPSAITYYFHSRDPKCFVHFVYNFWFQHPHNLLSMLTQDTTGEYVQYFC